MLMMFLIIASVGTAAIALIIAAMEWRALAGYWRASSGKLPN